MSKPVTISKEDELIKNCPKAIAKLKEWLAKELQEVPDSEEAEMLVIMVLRYNPRILYDFFDDMGIQIFPSVGDNKFLYDIYINKGHFKEGDYFSSRAEAEEIGFKEAFNILENEDKSKG